MKTKPNFKRLLTGSYIALMGLTVSLESSAQKPNAAELEEFKITIERTEQGIKMQSQEGSAWIDLSFPLASNTPQAIDEFGMTELASVSPTKDPRLSDYLFTITKTKEGITLTGIEGTAWKELSFPLQKNGKQSINQFGMTE